jgi:hypothetical protein
MKCRILRLGLGLLVLAHVAAPATRALVRPKASAEPQALLACGKQHHQAVDVDVRRHGIVTLFWHWPASLGQSDFHAKGA